MVKILDRLLLFVYSLAVGIVSFILLFISVNWIKQDVADQFVHNVYYLVSVRNAVIAFALVTILISVRFFYLSLRRNKANAPSIDQRTDFGEIRISLETVENLALKAASRVRGVKDLKARIRVGDAGLEIVIRSIVDGESSIPVLTEEVQRSVKDHVEDITGIPVAHVSVFVANLIQSSAFKSRVE